MLSDKTFHVKLICIFSFIVLLSHPALSANVAPTVGDDFQDTVSIQNPNRHIQVGDYFHVIDGHGKSVGLIRIMIFDSSVCTAQVVEGQAPFGSALSKDTQMTADRNRRPRTRSIASDDQNGDKVGAKRPEEPPSSASAEGGEPAGWRSWTPLKGWPMRKMIFVGISPSSAYVSNSASASPNINMGYTLGFAAEFMHDVKGFEVGLKFYQAGFNFKSSSDTLSYVFDYIGIPILFKYAVINNEDWSLRLKGGLMESFLMSKTQLTNSTPDSTSFKMAQTDTLLTIGADVMFPGSTPDAFNYWLQLTFSYGLMNINPNVISGAVNNEVLNFSGGIYF